MSQSYQIGEQRVIVLAKYGGFSHAAIADRVGWEVSEVKKVLYRERVLISEFRQMLTPEAKRLASQIPRMAREDSQKQSRKAS